MGCGSSSLKGDAPQGIGGDNDPAPRPIKKIATNFSTVDYADPNAGKGRQQTEFAPHETERQPSAIDEAVEHANNGVEQKDTGLKEGENLEPYRTIEGDEPLSPGVMPPKSDANFMDGVKHDNADPTSQKALNDFATENDPASNAYGGGPSDTTGSDGKKKSWLGKKYSQYSDARDGRNNEISEEDMQKYTGKSKDDINNLMTSGNGVGAGQSNSMRDTPGPGTGMMGLAHSGSYAGGGA